MRRLFLILAGAAVLAAAGCGDRTGSDIPTTTAAPQTMPTLDGGKFTLSPPPPAKRARS